MSARRAFHVCRVLFLQSMTTEEGQEFDLTLAGYVPARQRDDGDEERAARLRVMGGDIVREG